MAFFLPFINITQTGYFNNTIFSAPRLFHKFLYLKFINIKIISSYPFLHIWQYNADSKIQVKHFPSRGTLALRWKKLWHNNCTWEHALVYLDLIANMDNLALMLWLETGCHQKIKYLLSQLLSHYILLLNHILSPHKYLFHPLLHQ